MSRSADTAVPRATASAFQFSNATSYGRRSSVMPSTCAASTMRPCSSTQPPKPGAPDSVSVAIRQARTVSGRAPFQRALRASNTLLSGITNRLSACTTTRTSFADMEMGSNTGSVMRAPTLGRSPSATASGTSVGSSTGPGSFTRCVSGCPSTPRSARMSSVSPSTLPDALIGASPASISILKLFTRSARVSTTSERAVARCS